MEAAFDALAAGRHGDPFSVLGRHGDIVRSFQPGARGVALLSRADGRERAMAEAMPAATQLSAIARLSQRLGLRTPPM